MRCPFTECNFMKIHWQDWYKSLKYFQCLMYYSVSKWGRFNRKNRQGLLREYYRLTVMYYVLLLTFIIELNKVNGEWCTSSVVHLPYCVQFISGRSGGLSHRWKWWGHTMCRWVSVLFVLCVDILLHCLMGECTVCAVCRHIIALSDGWVYCLCCV